VQRQLSCWLRGLVTVHASYGAANASLVQFFKAQGAAARAVRRQRTALAVCVRMCVVGRKGGGGGQHRERWADWGGVRAAGPG
jgi:hypothetical protein